MSQFTNNVSIKPIPKTRKRVTTSDITRNIFYDDENNTGTHPITVPKGYVFDGASVPSGLFVVFLFLGAVLSKARLFLAVFGIVIQRTEANTILAATVHDYIYTDRPHGLTLGQADRIFYEALVACGTPKRKAIFMYYGVRMGGWFYRYKFPTKIKNLFKRK